MPSLSPIETRAMWLPKGVDSMTLWPFIMYRQGRRDSVPLRCHEYFHWRQALRWGVLPWYLVYLALKPFYIRGAPDRHPLEAPAYAKEREIRALLDAGESIDEQLAELGLSL